MTTRKLISPANFVFLLLLLASCNADHPAAYTTWSVFGGSKENNHYSSLKEIDTANVQKLQVAWIYHTGDADTASHSQIQCNPIIVNGVVYATSPKLKLLALDAATGKEKWVFNPADSNQNKTFVDFILNNNRGVTWWEEGDDKRIFYTAGSMIYAINANTGKVITSFGNGGSVDLHEGLGADAAKLYVAATSPGIIYKDLLIMGSRVAEESNAAPGYIRAYDVHTGKQRWVFHTIPQPGEDGYDTWEDPNAWKHIGGANCWSGFSMDEKRGIVYAPIGSASFDFYGGMRKGSLLYADCLLALDAATGKHLWHFQDIHHDIWDRDFPTPPSLITVMHEGKQVDAVAQPTKTGFVFVLDRVTGKPLFPVEERPVPSTSELAGEKPWPTQPFPVAPKPFARQIFRDEDVNDLLPDSSIQEIKKKLAGYKHAEMFTPPSREGTVILPGFDGGAEWGGPAADPNTGIFYVNANDIPWVLTMVEAKTTVPKDEVNLDAGKRLYARNCMNCHGPERKGSGNFPSLLGVEKKYTASGFTDLMNTGRRMMPAFKQLSGVEKTAIASFILDLKSEQHKKFVEPPKPVDTFRNLPYTITGYNKFRSKDGYPAIKPPWGTLTAIDLNTGEFAWRIPLGEYPDLKKKGIISGTENYGGPAVTAGGLLFIAATRDGKFRAFNKRTGQLLWEFELPVPAYATPSVYAVNGRQFIVVACGGGKLDTKSGDSYMAFALPQ